MVTAKFAAVTDEFAEKIAALALDCTLVNAKFTLVTAKFATVTLENAEDVAILALWTTTAMVDEAEPCADLIPLSAEIEACLSC